MTAGRPSKYDPAFCERVIELGAEGMGPAEIAGELDIDKATLYRWRDKYCDFATALTRAKTQEQRWWESRARLAMLEASPNPTIWAKSMQARFPDDYTERKVLQGDANNPLYQEVRNVIVDPKAGDNST